MFRAVLKVVSLLFVILGVVMMVVGHSGAGGSNPDQAGSYMSAGAFLIVIFGACFGLMFVKKAI
jgi:hypothetical protein